MRSRACTTFFTLILAGYHACVRECKGAKVECSVKCVCAAAWSINVDLLI